MKNLRKQSPSLDTYISWTNLTAAYLESHNKTPREACSTLDQYIPLNSPTNEFLSEDRTILTISDLNQWVLHFKFSGILWNMYFCRWLNAAENLSLLSGLLTHLPKINIHFQRQTMAFNLLGPSHYKLQEQ